MLNWIVHFSLRQRGAMVTLAGVLLVYGLYVAWHAQLDVFPDFVPPQVVIQTEAPGLSPEQVEMQVTRPVETAVRGLGNQESVRSESIPGLSIVTVVFQEGTEVFRARQMLAEKLGETTGQLPAGVSTPKMTPLTSSTMDLLKIGLISDRLSPMELRTFAEWTLRPRLLAVAGVAKCSLFGGEVRQLQIQVQPDRLLAHEVSLPEVLTAARVATGLRGAGFIETANQRILIQTEGQSLTPEVLGDVAIVQSDGQSVRLKDVARVVEAPEPKFGDTVIQGRPGVLMTMSSQFGANTMEVTAALESALSEMKPTLVSEGITVYPRLHRPATFIETALRNIRASLLLGGVLVAGILFLFLGNFRTALISLIAIPLSLLSAVILLDHFGVTLNTITLGGLAIAIGEVVDDAIIDVENIFRRLRENQGLALPRPVFTVVLEASIEIRSAVVYATVVVAMVFLPVLTLTGLQGKFFAPLALSYLLAILSSLVIALTLTPALAYLCFARGVHQPREPRLQSWLKAIYRRILDFLVRWPRTMMALVLVICVAAGLRLPYFGGDFLPAFREGHFVLQVSAAPGTALAETLRIGRQICRALLNHPHIATAEQQVGRAEQGEDPWGPHRSEFHVDLKPLPVEEEEKMADEIRGLLGQFPGLQFEVLTFLGDRIGETISGETASVVVSLFGEDLDVLDAKALEVAQLLRSLPGAQDVQVKSPPGSPRMAVELRPERLTQFGFRPVEILEALQTAYQGTVVAQTYLGNRVSDVAVVLDPSSRRDPETIGSLFVSNLQGARLPLRELAVVYLTSGRHSILHDGARRRQAVTCNPSGRDVASFVQAAKQKLAATVNLPAGVYAVFTGAAEARKKAQQELLLHSAVAGVGILLLLAAAFGNWRNLLLALANLPFALVGGVVAIMVTGGELSLGSVVGLVTLFGVSTRNSIMLISHFEHLVSVEGLTWGLAAALRGATERLLPILMTALVTALGLLPLAYGSGEPGREIEGPMATVIVGGLLTSTALNLLVLPSLALRYGRFGRKAG